MEPESEVKHLSPKTGRPKLEKPKITSLHVRLDEETTKRLVEYCEEHKIKRIDAIRQGVCLLLAKEK